MILTDQWIVGFVDGDGCFKFYEQETGNYRFIFAVSQDKRSIDVLYALKKKFGCGSVHSAGGGGRMYEYKVTDKDNLKKFIVPFFKKNPLQTQKINDFIKFVEALTNTQYPFQESQALSPLNRDWLIGFIDAEGCFSVPMCKKRGKITPIPKFIIGLHIRDKDIIEKIKAFMGTGIIYEIKRKSSIYIYYQISSQEGFNSIIKFCTTGTNDCLLKTIKRIDFLKFKKSIELITEEKRLSDKVIETIYEIKKCKIESGLL